ncbi:MAG: hemerythrin domain-containing protein, partial [Terriglobia bacterium]
SATRIPSAQHQEHGKSMQTFTAKPALATPPSIHGEHKHLHHQLDQALASGGKTAASARAVADVLLPHFEAEEAYAMPPLGLLEAIAQNQPLSDEQTRETIKMADQLQAHYGQMIQEHQQIQAALKTLASAAREEHKPEALAFAEELMLHAQNEEQILYPTTLLIGKYLKLRQAAGQGGGDSDRTAAPAKP